MKYTLIAALAALTLAGCSEGEHRCKLMSGPGAAALTDARTANRVAKETNVKAVTAYRYDDVHYRVCVWL